MNRRFGPNNPNMCFIRCRLLWRFPGIIRSSALNQRLALSDKVLPLCTVNMRRCGRLTRGGEAGFGSRAERSSGSEFNAV
jgi:hypothetical protein